MYKIKIFSGEQPDLLQQTVNDWLHMNKDIFIHNSSLSGSNAGNFLTGEYVFYILYTRPEEEADQLKDIAAAATQDHSIEVKEINPEIMKPSS